ncbi:glycoside hydrolase family 3 protein [Suillus fuscotomentosus]|uniref:xylan 1,4-beta-xylosidase n=1 Tax=Suillus fuscotomentosus TaxID=1912939 RepID=A0AAD4HHQ1_9AGAM|nr:glycoside hydrolase family 3 protein [Suillus fuscotomentosus]KAG1896606.1 glycoside hydrolase family 3 protein [Suillus fuscotomentosus]
MRLSKHVALVYALVAGSVTGYVFPDCEGGPLASNAICNTALDPITRATSLVKLFTVPELINNTVNRSPGVPRLGLPAYQWWSEALHGVANSPGVNFSTSGEFSYATSFPQPISMGATFDDELIKSVGGIVGMEGRAFNNYGRAGLDFWTPNINPFKDPRWGRGQETPGEDPYHLSQYVYNLVVGLQGGLDPKPYYQVVSTCKHFAGYDLEDWDGTVRYGFNAVITSQDLVEYYLPSFQSCYRDAKVGAAMCSYNAINGVPSCADPYLLQDILRDFYGFAQDRWVYSKLLYLCIVTSDCDAVQNIYSPHNYATPQQAVADALKAGTDLDCGSFYGEWLPIAYKESLITETDLRTALVHQYASLVRLGYFDPEERQPYRTYNWSSVNIPIARQLAYRAAVEGIVLLKNDGTLPLSSSIKNIALIGPWANATTQMQGNYFGVAPYLTSPVMGAMDDGYNVTYLQRKADAVIYAGGIDLTVEDEALDRYSITWPGNQLDLIAELEMIGKPLVVVQFGGGQLDDSILKGNASVNALVWAGYPGQSGGKAVFDTLSGKVAPAGRLPITQYPASYVNEIPMTNMNLRPNLTSPGRTYIWYTGMPVYEFGYGEHYTTFCYKWVRAPATSYSIQALIDGGKYAAYLDVAPFATLAVSVTNTGNRTSDYVSLLFASGMYGDAPYPNKLLVSYTRSHGIMPGTTATAELPITLGNLARADTDGNFWLYPGTYELALDTSGVLTSKFKLTGSAARLTSFPQNTMTS